MFLEFSKYFFTYIFKAKTRQKLLFLAIFGLFLSAFSLLVLQSTMGGLQEKLMGRSKRVNGQGIIQLFESDESFAREVISFLKDKKHEVYGEYEIELLMRYSSYLSPVVIHAIDQTDGLPSFLQKESLEGLIVPRELAGRIGLDSGAQVELISPSHVDSLMGDIPRLVTVDIENVIATDVPEVDLYHAWTRLPLIQNLIRSREINRIRIMSDFEVDLLRGELNNKFGEKVSLQTWEDQNKTLVWSLALETSVMIFLFMGMTLLVALCITSGLMIFFSKIKGDLSSFWILGASKDGLNKASSAFLLLMSFISVSFGIICALLFLFLLDRYGFEIMPEVFVDRKIPVYVTLRGLAVSFLVPFVISLLFSFFSLRQFKRESNYLDYVRTIG